jgi:hypothetical protein
MTISRNTRIVVYVSGAEARAIRRAAKPIHPATFLRDLGLRPPPATVTHRDIYAHLSQWNQKVDDLGRRYATAAPPSLLQDLRDLRQSILETQRTLITPAPEGDGDHVHQDS